LGMGTAHLRMIARCGATLLRSELIRQRGLPIHLMRTLRISIIGGSLAGLFAALLLRKDGHEVRIHERSRHGLSGRGAGLVAQAKVFQILRRLGHEEIADVGVVARERIYLDKMGQVAETRAMPQMQVSWDVLHDTLARDLEDERYTLGQEVEAVELAEQGAMLRFRDGSTHHTDLVVGADGIGSIVRKFVNPSRHRNIFAGYSAWRGLVPETALPAEAVILIDRFAFYLARGAHALGYLVPGSKGEMAKGHRRYNWVWYRPGRDDRLGELFTDTHGRSHPFSLPRGGLSAERLASLRHDAAEILPPQFAQAVATEDEPSIQGIFDYEAPRMVRGPIVLIGDAAFVVRPHTAMGVSKAAGDVMALQHYLAAEENLDSALAAFERERIAVGREISAYGRRLGASAL